MAAGFTLSDVPARGVTVSSRNRLGEMLAVAVNSATTLTASMVRRLVTHGVVSSETVATLTLVLRLRGLGGDVLSRTPLAATPRRVRQVSGLSTERTTVVGLLGGPRGVVVAVTSVTDVAGTPQRTRQLNVAVQSLTTLSDTLRNLTYLTDDGGDYLTDSGGDSFLVLS